jgi:hypothetical protein
LSTVENCPECNGYYGANRSERRFQLGNQGLSINEPIRGGSSVHDWLGGRLSVHERLGKCAGYFPRNQEELEKMANARVPDEEIFYRDPNIRHVESIGTYYQPVLKTKLSRWCPKGLTKTQKRRMQRERQEDLYREESSSNERFGHRQWQVKHKDKGTSADVNMVFMLPMEFLALSDDKEEVVLSDQVAQLALDPMMVVFEKPIDDERQHLKTLFVKG